MEWADMDFIMVTFLGTLAVLLLGNFAHDFWHDLKAKRELRRRIDKLLYDED